MINKIEEMDWLLMFSKIIAPPAHIQFNNGSQTIHLMRSRPHHASALIEGLNESLKELRAFMPWAHFENTLESQTQRLTHLESQWDQNKDFTFNIFLENHHAQDQPDLQETHPKKNLHFAGCVGMHLNCLSVSGVEIGYWVRTSEAGKGLCTLATRLLVYIGFECQKVRRIKITCDTVNEASRRVIEKVGFPYEGRLRNGGYLDAPAEVVEKGWRGEGDLFLYGMTPDDYPSLPWIEQIRNGISFDFPIEK